MQRVRRRSRRAAWAFAVAVALSIVAVEIFGAAIINGLSSNHVYRQTAGIAYGEHPRQVLDVYAPAGAAGAAPVLLFFYGGGWTEGTRTDYEFVASSFAREGYLVKS